MSQAAHSMSLAPVVEQRILQQAVSTMLTRTRNSPFRILEIAAPSLDMAAGLNDIAAGVAIEHLVTHPSTLHLAGLRRRAKAFGHVRFATYDPALSSPPDSGPFDLIIAAPGAAPMPRVRDRLATLLTPDGCLVTWAREDGPDGVVIAEEEGVRLIDIAVPCGGHVGDRRSPASVMADADGGNAFPLTDIQHAYWVGRGDMLSLGGVACHVYFEWELPDLDPKRLERAWNALIERHGMLRAIVTADGEQRILQEAPYYMVAVDDASGLSPPEAEACMLATRARMSAQVLDAHHWPLFEVSVTRLTDTGWCLHLDLDLLIVDVQSFHILLSELETLYRDAAALPPAPAVTFRDYRLALARDRESPEFLADRDWWLGRIDDLPPPPALPFAKAPDAVSAPTFRRLRRRLAQDQWRRLEQKARAHGLTSSSLLLGAFSEVLARWAAEPRFLLNLTQFDRRPLHPDVMRLVGDFTSVLLIDVDAAGHVSFAERTRAVQATLWRALSHARFGGVEILRELSHRRSRRGDALMPVVFTSLLGLDIDALVHRNGGGVMLGEPSHLYTCTPQVWLDHQAMIRNGSLEYNWIVIDDLFPPRTADAMFEAYGVLLDHLACDDVSWDEPAPDALLPAEEAEARRRANDTATPLPLTRLERVFLDRAAASPDAIALIAPDGVLTYRALRERVEALAGALDEIGIVPGEAVGVALPKSADQIAAVLAVLYCGAFYVPLAHDLPDERLGAIMTAAGMRAAFGSVDARPWPHGVAILDPAAEPCSRRAGPRGDLSLDDLAYVIYTSGSTGTPKGVMVTHRAAANTIVDVNIRTGCSERDRIFCLSALGFDLSVYDIFGPLMAGAALVLPAEEERREPAAWLRRMANAGVSIWNSVPALMQMLVEHAGAQGESLPGLRWALLSGDWVPLALPARIHAFAPHCRIAALGGATEAAIWSNWHEVREPALDWPSIPYGFPLANQRYHILDSALRPRPDWVEGDLYIAGDGLARGYHGDPEQTVRAFFVHPRTGERLYRTGDRARYRPGGIIEFLGRADRQVKINGLRIELGEIETRLAAHADIQAAVVDTVDTGHARKLVGYVVPSGAPRDLIKQRVLTAEQADQPWRAARTAFAAAAERRVDAAMLKSLAEFEHIGEALGEVAIRRALVILGLGNRNSIDPHHAAPVAPHYRGLLRQWLHGLAKKGLYRQEGRLHVRIAPLGDAAALGGEMDLLVAALRGALAWATGGAGLADWIDTCVRSLPDILQRPSGEALALLFPGGDFGRSEALYQNNILAAHLGGIIAEGIAAYAEAGDGRPLRIMELGAGVGGLTAYLLPRLASLKCDYLYTDVSSNFLAMAQEKFRSFDFVRYGLYDIRLSPEEQTKDLHSIDVVLAGNVLHNARDASVALAALKRLLAPGGMLAFIEATRNKMLQLVTGGLIEGLHAEFDDTRRATGLPMLSADAWCSALDQAGFRAAAVAPPAGHSMGAFGQQVIAAAAPSAACVIEASKIDTYLRAALPDYMVPSCYVLIDQIPLSSNGKVDRSLLPRPFMPDVRPGERMGEAPREGLEAAVAGAWRAVLGCTDVFRTDNFFTRGGDSLTATRLATALRKELGRDIALRLLFDHPVLADQAAAVAALRIEARKAPLLLASGPKGPLVCFHASDGHAAAYHPLARRLEGVCAVVAADAPGLAPDEAPLDGLADLVARHRAIMGETPAGGWQLLGWSMGAYTAWALAAELIAAGEPVARVMLVDPSPRTPFEAAIRSPGALLESCADEALRIELVDEGLTVEALDALPDGDRLKVWRRVLQRHGVATSLLSDDGALARMVAVLAANLAAMVEARLAPMPAGSDIVVYTAARRPPVWGEPLADWSALLPSSARHVVIDADHWSILASDALAQDVSGRIA